MSQQFKNQMLVILYVLVQCTWGCIQTAAGFFIFLQNRKCPHSFYHGAVVTVWDQDCGLSLGMFLFVPETEEDFLLRHEYGHGIQSVLLGPLYLIVIGLPSIIWARWSVLKQMRQEKRISYYDFYTERWANWLSKNN